MGKGEGTDIFRCFLCTRCSQVCNIFPATILNQCHFWPTVPAEQPLQGTTPKHARALRSSRSSFTWSPGGCTHKSAKSWNHWSPAAVPPSCSETKALNLVLNDYIDSFSLREAPLNVPSLPVSRSVFTGHKCGMKETSRLATMQRYHETSGQGTGTELDKASAPTPQFLELKCNTVKSIWINSNRSECLVLLNIIVWYSWETGKKQRGLYIKRIKWFYVFSCFVSQEWQKNRLRVCYDSSHMNKSEVAAITILITRDPTHRWPSNRQIYFLSLFLWN